MGSCEDEAGGVCADAPPAVSWVGTGEDRRPSLIGSGWELAELADAAAEHPTPHAAARALGVPRDHVELALAYAERDPDDVARWLEAGRRVRA